MGTIKGHGKMNYRIDTYKNNRENSLRFLLGKSGTNPLFVMGLNPSTADENKPDQTITKIMRFANLNGFDGFIMLNLYPQRTPFPANLDKELNCEYHSENIEIIKEYTKDFKELNVLAAWGEPIKMREYLTKCLRDLKNVFDKVNTDWIQIGDFTKNGHPRHPSRASYGLGLKPMDLNQYLKNLTAK